jgi:ABC-type nitrate/sulfonate/bicarbonate transport system ATPase subunit
MNSPAFALMMICAPFGSGKTAPFVFVTHSVTEAAYLAERALVMQAGEIKSEIAIDQTDRADDFRSAPPYIAACAALSQALGHKRAAAK